MSSHDAEDSSLLPPPAAFALKRRPRQPLSLVHRFLIVFCAVAIMFQLTGTWPATIAAFAAQQATPTAANNTYDDFTKVGEPDQQHYHGPLQFPTDDDAAKQADSSEQADLTTLVTAEPAKMQPLAADLDSSLVTPSSLKIAGLSFAPTSTITSLNARGTVAPETEPVTLKGSDKRLDVSIAEQSFDFSTAKTTKKSNPKGKLTLKVTQLFGHYRASMSFLGAYKFQVVDANGDVVRNVKLKKPLTLVYHYTIDEMRSLNLDPDGLVFAWPQDNADAKKNNTSAQGFTVPLVNDPQAQTLTAQVTTLGTDTGTLGGGDELQSPPKPNIASVQGNSGQLGYSYPLTVVEGTGNTTPKLSLNYSSQVPNAHSRRTSPAGTVGEGWSLPIGSISAEEYPSSSPTAGTWYSISLAGGISDRLVPHTESNGDTSYLTQHISQWKILKKKNATCFDVWDPSGNYYTFGCDTDSLQYVTNSTGRKNYRWDVDGVTLANEGPGTDSRFIDYYYQQDKVTKNSYTSVRDAVVIRITYGTKAKIAGTVDFLYKAPFTNAPWASAYGSNYNCSAPIATTTLRCDNPVDHPQGLSAATVMSTFSLQTVKSYVGDVSANQLAYSYDLQYADTPYLQCWDGLTQIQVYCAGTHLLQKVTPTIYQNNTAHPQKAVTFGYSDSLKNWYSDPDHQFVNGQPFTGQTYWNYLNSYYDAQMGTGGSVSYKTAYNNTNGTPNDPNGPNRYDPLYCSNHTDCTGTFNRPDQYAWSVQVVTAITQKGKDSSSMPEATTSYAYRLAKTGTNCPAAGTMKDCVGDTFIPKDLNGVKDQDWLDLYHGEFRGFNAVYITSPGGDLTAQYYYSTAGLWTYQGSTSNFLSGNLYQQDMYWGNALDDNSLIQRSTNSYPGLNGTANSCDGNYDATYTPCEVMVLTSRTTDYYGSNPTVNSNAPWVQHDYTYDDYRNGSGLGDYASGSYHNLQQEVITSSNAPTVTKKYTYARTNTVVNGWVYYNVHNVQHSEIVDANNHVWQCQDTSYDETGRGSGAPTPSAGLVTTQKAYADCTNQATTTLKSYQGYDSSYNPVVGVDAFGAAHSTVYATKGCTVGTAPAFFTTNWTATRYTGCSSYDTYNTRPLSSTNVLGQTSQMTYDYSFGGTAKTATNANNQVSTVTTSFDANHNPTVQSKAPGETGTYTNQSTTSSTCASSSSLPCFQIVTNSSLYPGAVTRTFYNSMGEAVETRKPLDATHDIVTFSVDNPSNDTKFQSQPFRVAAGSAWIDPATAKDDQGNTPAGTTTLYDPLGRAGAIRSALYGTSGNYGVNCPGIGTWTTCTDFGLGSGYNNLDTCPVLTLCYYDKVYTIDPDGHITKSLVDALGRTIQQEWYDASGNVSTYKRMDYTVLNSPTTITVVDVAPQSGQTITSVTTTMTYDDLGRVTQLNDPDRGIHTYSYDENGRQTKDVSGTRTLGVSYDLLGRGTCLQEGNPTTDGSGLCGNGNRPLIENTYDVSKLSVVDGSTTFPDYPIGKATQSIATTYYPDGTSAQTTQKVQYDQRGRATATTLGVSLPSAWNVTTALPTYEMLQWYNNANQPTMTKTRTSGQVNFTFSQAYDSTTGTQIGLSKDSSGSANLAKLSYNVNGLTNSLSFLSAAGNSIATANYTYDGNLRSINTTATWDTASGSTGTFFQSSRWYDPAGNVMSVATTHAAVPGQSNSGGSEIQNYCYDEQNRLVWSGNTGTQPSSTSVHCGSQTLNNTLNGATYSNSFTFTNLGQQWQAPLNSTGQYQYLYCNASKPHQLSGVYPTGTTCANQTGALYSATYDAWGNIATRAYNSQTAQLSYDSLDHLVKWDVSATNREWYVYDASGQRVLKRSTDTSATTLKTYAFGLEEHSYDSVGQPKNNGNTYYYMLGGRAIGKYDGTSTQFYLTDGLGSVVSSFSNTEGSAALKGNQVYSPYGKKRYQSGDLGTEKGFTGQYEDSTGLKYYNARYYDAVVGRFITADTVEGNAQGVDPYTYVGGNPTTKNDPTGHFVEDPGKITSDHDDSDRGNDGHAGGAGYGGGGNNGAGSGGGNVPSHQADNQTKDNSAPTPKTDTSQKKEEPETTTEKNCDRYTDGRCAIWYIKALEYRDGKLKQINDDADTKMLLGYLMFITGDILIAIGATLAYERIVAIVDIIVTVCNSILPLIANKLNAEQAAGLNRLASWMETTLSVLNTGLALLAVGNAWVIALGYVFELGTMVLGPAQALTKILFAMFAPVVGHLMDAGGQALQAIALLQYADTKEQSGMPLADWCSKYGGCPAY